MVCSYVNGPILFLYWFWTHILDSTDFFIFIVLFLVNPNFNFDLSDLYWRAFFDIYAVHLLSDLIVLCNTNCYF